MTRSYVEAPATHFRLKPETWALIAEEYRNGATAKDIGAKWKVAPSSVYRYACRDGWTKKSMGDARSRAHAQMVEGEEAAARAMQPVGSRALKSLFAPAPAEDPDASDAAALARSATLASGRAMKGRLWAEAKALAALAESYGRVASSEDARTAGTVETLPLRSVMDVRLADAARIAARFHISERAGVKDPDRELKERYRAMTGIDEQIAAAKADYVRSLKAHVGRLEASMRQAGLVPPEFSGNRTVIEA